jgi:hypothetical protein
VAEGACGDLASRVTAEDLTLAEFSAQVLQSFFDRVVELADRLVAVPLARSSGRCGLFEAEEHLECFGPEREQREFQRPVAVGQVSGVGRQHPRCVEPRLSTDGVE